MNKIDEYMNKRFDYKVVCGLNFFDEYRLEILKYFNDYFKALKYAAGRCAIHGHAFVCNKQGKVLNVFNGSDAIIVTEDYVAVCHNDY